jgi:hypothetical protein
MTKIAILTFHNTNNYGAMLQTYALQRKLEELCCHVSVLDYRNTQLEKCHSKKALRDQRSIKSFVLYLLLGSKHNKVVKRFRDFRKNYIRLTDVLYFKGNISESNDYFDVFIVGSDQVWNNQITGNDTTYLLDFVREDKKIASYAASFGFSEVPDVLQPIYKALLSRFTSISVREKEAIKIISNLVGRDDSLLVLDPTLLLTKKEWDAVAGQVRYVSEKYVLVYVFGRPKFLYSAARIIAKQMGCKIYIIGADYRKQIGFHYLDDLGPQEFLWYMNNASFVITNSFHGSVYSIIFNKQFYVDHLAISSKTGSRLSNLVRLFDLQSRVLKTLDSINLSDKIDFIKIEKILCRERAHSIEILKSFIL